MLQHLFRHLAPASIIPFLLPLLFLSCDEPNTPDVPYNPYSVASVNPLPDLARDVSVSGTYCAVACNQYGPLVFDIADRAHPDTIFHYPLAPLLECTSVAMDALHKYCIWRTLGSDPEFGTLCPVYDVVADTYRAVVNFSGPFGDLEIEPYEDTLRFWGTDETNVDGFVAARACRDPGSDHWSTGCGLSWQSWVAPGGILHGFGRKDTLFALAADLDGIHVHTASNHSVFNFDTPGIAFDCAWYGNYILVADQYHLLVVDASDPAHPLQAGLLNIPNADRLQKIVMDGHYACLLDDVDGIYVVDMSRPLSPLLVQEIPLPEPTGIAAGDGVICATDESLGLVVYIR